MPGLGFYKSREWRRLRQRVLNRAAGVCEVDGCWERAAVVDHIEARPRGVEGMCSADREENLRALCRRHDNEVKEDRLGRRRSGGEFSTDSWGADGLPLDARHPWNME